MTHSARFEELKAKYERGGCRKDQLRQYVELGVITAAEYKTITGEKY